MSKWKRASFAFSSLSFVVSLAAQRGLPFLALPIVARVTSQSEYGHATFSVAISSVLSVCMTVGINAAMPSLYARAATGRNQTWVSLIAIQLVIVVAVVLVGIVGLSIIGDSWGSDFRRFGAPTLLLAATTSIQMTYQGLAIARAASLRLLFATLVQLSAGLLFVYVLASANGGVGYLYAMILGSCLATAILATFRHPLPDWTSQGIIDSLRLSVPFIGQGLSTWLVALFDRIAIGLLLGADEVGGYQAAYMAGSVLGMVLEGLQAAWAPRYYKSDARAKDDALRRLVLPSTVLAAVLALLLIAAAPIFMPWVVPDYEIIYMVVFLVALTAVPRSIYFIAVAKLLDARRSGTVMMATVISGAFTVPAALVLIPVLGPTGGALVSLVAFVIQASIVFVRAFAQDVLTTVGRILLALVLVGTVGTGLMIASGFGALVASLCVSVLLALAVWAAARAGQAFVHSIAKWA
jgi:O-antigen/teichoic acid export membrane protein